MICGWKKMLLLMLGCGFGALPLAAGVDQALSPHFAVEFTETSTDLDAVLEFCRRTDRLIQRSLRGTAGKKPIPVRLMLMQEMNGGRWRWEMRDGEGRLCFGADFRNWRQDTGKRDLLLAVLLQCRLGLDPVSSYKDFPWWIAASLNDYFDRQQALRGPQFLPYYGYLRSLFLAGAAIRPRPEHLEPPAGTESAAEKAVNREYRLLTLELAFQLSGPGRSVLAEWILRSARREPQEKIFAELLEQPVTASLEQSHALFGLPPEADPATKRDLAMRRMTRRMLFRPYAPLPAEQLTRELTALLQIPRKLTPEGEPEGEETVELAELPYFAERNSRYARLALARIPELRELVAVAAPATGAALEKLIRFLGAAGRGRPSRTKDQIQTAVTELRRGLERQQTIERFLENYERQNQPLLQRSRQLLELAERRRDPLPPQMERAFDRAAKEYLER